MSTKKNTKKNKTVKKDYFSNEVPQNIIYQSIDKCLYSNYMPYAMYVIVSRALPDVMDGLKPIHRKILYTGYKMKLSPEKKTKSANFVGQIMKIHPHGDCLDGETKVMLANGSVKTIKELYESGLDYDIYSVNEDGSITITKATHFRIGQMTKTIYEISLSDGSVIKTTNNHPFLTRDLKWIKAEDLKINQFLYTANMNIDLKNKSFRPTIKTTSLFVTNINVVTLEEEIPMYDFTVNGTENMLIVRVIMKQNIHYYLYIILQFMKLW